MNKILKKSIFILSFITFFSNADDLSIRAKEFVDNKINLQQDSLITYSNIDYNNTNNTITLNNVHVKKKELENSAESSNSNNSKYLINEFNVKKVSFSYDLENHSLLTNGRFLIEGLEFPIDAFLPDNKELYSYFNQKNINKTYMNYGFIYNYSEESGVLNSTMLWGLNDFMFVKINPEFSNFNNAWKFLNILQKNNYNLPKEEKKNFNPVSTFGMIKFNSINLEIINKGGISYLIEKNAEKENITKESYLDNLTIDIMEDNKLIEEEKNIVIDFIHGTKNNLTFSLEDKSPLSLIEIMSYIMGGQFPEEHLKSLRWKIEQD